METKEQLIYRLLFEQKITPEQAEVLMQEPQWKYDPNTWTIPTIGPIPYEYPWETISDTGKLTITT